MTTLEMKNVSIEFPGVRALHEVNFLVESGQVHALIGANGAGKSTLMKVLSGAYNHYTGDISLNGQSLLIRSPKEAMDAGIQIVYQEVDTALIPYLTVAENIVLLDMVQSKGSKHWVNWKNVHQKAAAVLTDLHVTIPTTKLVSELTLAEKQMVLIARAVSRDCKFLILDEPTAPLSQSETKELFRLISSLKSRQVGIIFISHRLPEIFEICDGITIMRNGEVVARETIAATSANQVVEQMLGQSLGEQFPTRLAEMGQTVLEVNNLTDHNKVKNFSMHAKAGEIIGIAGLVGAGKTELCKALFGMSGHQRTGMVKVNGKQVKNSTPYQAVKNGFALVPEERRKEGILVHESVEANLTAVSLGRFTNRFRFVSRKKEKSVAQEWIRRLGIKTPTEETKVQNLSGGNQQKVAIGKWLIADADIYLFDEPTKGVDVGAKKDIFQLISDLAKRGKTILYASSELSEIIGITNRVYVLYDGQSVKELNTCETTEEELLYFSTGGR